MVRKALYPAVFVFVALTASQAFATNWLFWDTYTLTPDFGLDGRIYMPNGVDLVPMGSQFQFILDVAGDGFDDPLSFFDVNMNGQIDQGDECAAVQDWVRLGAKPLGDDVLVTGSMFAGVFGLTADGQANIYTEWGDPWTITVGESGMAMAWRCFSLSADEMATFTGGTELLYTTGTEKGSYAVLTGVPGHDYQGWTLGDAEAIPLDEWPGFMGYVGLEVYLHDLTGDPEYRAANILDHDLTCVVPEPGTMLLIGSSALLLFLRRKK